jgi:tight adherence protein B
VNGGASGRDAGDVSRGAGWAVTAPSRSARVGAGLERFVLARPKLFVLLTAVCCGAVGFAGGPVGAALGAIYAVPGAIAWRRRVARVRRDRIYEAMLEAIGNVTGDLRAGLVPEPLPALPTVEPNVDPAILMALARLTAAQRISEALGAPLADLMDRVDADLRGGHRLAMAVRAQTAGVQATAVILTGLPLMSIFLGAGMGVHPAHQLLHTRVGAGCVLSAALLQCGGLALTAAMVRAVIAEVRA